MKILLVAILLLVTPTMSSPDFIAEEDFYSIIKSRSAFGDDEDKIVIVEFWVQFNNANSFQDWDMLSNLNNYYLVDVSKSPAIKKDYSVRIAPTILILKNGVEIKRYSASLDMTCPVDYDELQQELNNISTASSF